MKCLDLHRCTFKPELAANARLGAVAVLGRHFGYSARRATGGNPFEGDAFDFAEPRDVHAAGSR